MAFDKNAEAALVLAAKNLSKVITESVTGQPAKDVLGIVGTVLVNEIKLTLSQPGTGRVYGNHQASAPGEPPAVDTGQLRNSITADTGQDEIGPYVDVGSSLEKAAYLEFGTSTIDPRPFMRPSVEVATPKMADELARGIVRAQQESIAKMPRSIKF